VQGTTSEVFSDRSRLNLGRIESDESDESNLDRIESDESDDWTTDPHRTDRFFDATTRRRDDATTRRRDDATTRDDGRASYARGRLPRERATTRATRHRAVVHVVCE